MNLHDEFLVFCSTPLLCQRQEVSSGRERSDPKLEAATSSRGNPDDAIPANRSLDCVNTIPRTKKLSLKLRQQAIKLGMLPGSPRWRAYVLGTTAAAAKRNRERRTKSESKEA